MLSELEDKEHAREIVELLRYDEDSAGGLMAKELVKVNLISLDMMAMTMMCFVNTLTDKKMIIRTLHITSCRYPFMELMGPEIMPPKTTP